MSGFLSSVRISVTTKNVQISVTTENVRISVTTKNVRTPDLCPQVSEIGFLTCVAGLLGEYLQKSNSFNYLL